MVLNFFNLVLKRYEKSIENDFLKCVGTLCTVKWMVGTADVVRSIVHRSLFTSLVSTTMQKAYCECCTLAKYFVICEPFNRRG